MNMCIYTHKKIDTYIHTYIYDFSELKLKWLLGGILSQRKDSGHTMIWFYGYTTRGSTVFRDMGLG